MKNNILKVHSFESMAALDGPGLRYAIFLGGCHLRCAYCHNPDTWNIENTTSYTVEEIVKKAVRFKPYFKKSGGVTITGGEPLLQAEVVAELTEELIKNNINVAIDTAGSIFNSSVKELLKLKPLLLLDIKMTDRQRFTKYTGGNIKTTFDFLKYADNEGCNIWLRYVVVPTINDKDEDIINLTKIGNEHKNVSNITLLPYHKLGIQKYEKLNIPYTLNNISEPTPQSLLHLNKLVKENFKPYFQD